MGAAAGGWGPLRSSARCRSATALRSSAAPAISSHEASTNGLDADGRSPSHPQDAERPSRGRQRPPGPLSLQPDPLLDPDRPSPTPRPSPSQIRPRTSRRQAGVLDRARGLDCAPLRQARRSRSSSVWWRVTVTERQLLSHRKATARSHISSRGGTERMLFLASAGRLHRCAGAPPQVARSSPETDANVAPIPVHDRVSPQPTPPHRPRIQGEHIQDESEAPARPRFFVGMTWSFAPDE